MQVFDLKDQKAFPYEQRDKNVFYTSPEFKTRVIELKPGENIPQCEMKSIVMFYVINGEVVIEINSEKAILKEGYCLVSDPGLFAMSSINGTKLIGIQVPKKITA